MTEQTPAIGTILPWREDREIPPGWVVCDGGVIDGHQIPDFREPVPLPEGAMAVVYIIRVREAAKGHEFTEATDD